MANFQLQRLTYKFIWIISVLLIIVGTLILFKFTSNFSINNWLLLLGTISLEVGIITLMFELLSLNALVTSKIPHAIFDHDYLKIANDDELVRFIDDSVSAKIGTTKEKIKDLKIMREWMLTSLSAPIRKNYRAIIELLDTPIVERFDDTSGSTIKQRQKVDTLWVKLGYMYTTEKQHTKGNLLINGDGIIHRVRDTIPKQTELWKLFDSGKISKDIQNKQSQEIVKNWIYKTIKPMIEIRSIDPQATQILNNKCSIDNLGWREEEGVLWMWFSIKSNYSVDGEKDVRVAYTQYWCIDSIDSHSWVAFNRTRGFRFTAINFDDFNLLPIGKLSLLSKDGELTIQNDLIEYMGMVYPNSMFAFAWSKKDNVTQG